MLHLLSLTTEELSTWLVSQGEAPFRVQQLESWLYQRRAESFDCMTDLPTSLRARLRDTCRIWSGSVVEHRTAADGTHKLLIEWPDGHRIECVLIPDGPRRTACISTQVGCAMGCVFCASGLDGVARNLTSGEILEQLLRLDRLLPAGVRLSNIVVMGMGEPLANLDALLPALERARSKRGLGVSPRKITISTVGLPRAIDRLAELGIGYHLAVSLHAPTDELRTRLVPVNRAIGLDAILAAAERYFNATHRRLTFEYVLLGGVNDQPEHARQLARLLSGKTALLNVIPYNPVPGLEYQTPTPRALRTFVELLRQAGVNVQVRVRKGDQIDAACGQLRRRLAAHA
jgi:23S rRNA (adenine2503-C2)-methyltransferase